MTKTDARIWALTITVKSLRRKARTLKPRDISTHATLTDKQVAKHAEAMNELADKLEAKLTRMEGSHDGRAREGDAPDVATAPEGDARLGSDRLPGDDAPVENHSDSSGDR